MQEDVRLGAVHPERSRNGSRNLWVDALRAVAALWVVFFHLNEAIPYEPSLYRLVAKQGWLGVPMFFVISGYCIRLTSDRSASSGAFLGRRLLRIWPPYLASLAVVLGVVACRHFLAGHNDVTVLPRGVLAWTETVLLLTTPATKLPTVNWVYWSLTVEVAFYFVFAALRVRRGMETFLVLLVCVASFSETLRTQPALFFLAWWPVFALGIALYELREDRSALKWLLLLVSVLAMAYGQRPAAVTAATLTAVVIGLSGGPFLAFRPPSALVQIGRWSYSLYLLHVPIGVHLFLTLRTGIFLSSPLAHVSYDVATVAACVGVAGVFHRLVEVPAIRASRAKTFRPTALLNRVAQRMTGRLRPAPVP